jgi:two-component system, NarL family, nitrate/nitrite response regulator NarL
MIVGEVRVFRDSLADALSSVVGMEVVGTAGDWAEAFGQIQHLRPDVVLVDAPLIAAGRGARLFADSTPDVRLVALAIDEEELAVLTCLEAGVSAYVRRDAELSELVETTRRAARGELMCSPRIAAALGRRLSVLAAEREPSNAVGRLTARELEIVNLIEQGLSNQEIADRLCIEVTTVKNHVHNILAKLHIRSRTGVAHWMRETRVSRAAAERR